MMDTLFARGKSITFTTSANFFGALAPAAGLNSTLCDGKWYVLNAKHAQQCTQDHLHLKVA